MMKQYFLQFDFWQTGVNKFWCGVVKIDLDETPLVEACRIIIKENWPLANFSTVEIKVNALNNIDT